MASIPVVTLLLPCRPRNPAAATTTKPATKITAGAFCSVVVYPVRSLCRSPSQTHLLKMPLLNMHEYGSRLWYHCYRYHCHSCHLTMCAVVACMSLNVDHSKARGKKKTTKNDRAVDRLWTSRLLAAVGLVAIERAGQMKRERIPIIFPGAVVR